MSITTHHTSTKTVADAKITRAEAVEVERAFRQAAQSAQWTYHHAAKLDPQGEQTERYRKLHAHAVEQWTAALANVKTASRELRRAQSIEGSRGNSNRADSAANARAARRARLGL